MTGDSPPTPDQVRDALKFAAINTAEVSTLAAAARDWLRIQEAEMIWWCEVHSLPSTPGVWDRCAYIELQPWTRQPSRIAVAKCRMVERRLI